MRDRVVYLDHHAATPASPSACQAMDEARADAWANPSSVHSAGRRAGAWLETTRRRLAQHLGAEPRDIVLTGGGTEACNLGLLGLGQGVAHVVTTAIEHPAVDQAVRRLERRGVAVTRVPVSAGAAPDELGGLIDEAEASGPWLLAVQWVNHETGTILPLRRWAREARERGARVVVDATQALGKLDVGPLTRDADAVAFAASKVGGPAGAGALWVRRGIDVVPVLAGGAQERGRRPGTLDVVAQAGFAGALADLEARRRAVEVLGAERDRLEAAVERLGGAVNGRAGPRVATVTNASFREWTGELLVAALDVEGVCASSGAACSSGLNEPSPVLAAMYPEEPWRARSALRLSLGPETSAREVTTAIRTLERVLARPTSSEP